MNKASMTPDEADRFLNYCERLPAFNSGTTRVSNRNGVLFEVVGATGRVKKVGVVFKKGVFYFDGNRIGKRKHRLAMSLYGGDGTSPAVDPTRVWRKIQEQGL